VNGYGTDTPETPLFPRAVVSALSAHGWSMGLGQQDSHELFFVLMTSLEEQTAQAAKPKNILALLNKDDSDQDIVPDSNKEDNNQNERNESVSFHLKPVVAKHKIVLTCANWMSLDAIHS